MKCNSFKLVLKQTAGFLLKSAFVLACSLFVPLRVFSQNIDKLNIEKVQDEGLTNNYINSILQDKNGFIWFGTGEGVFRYNGFTFKSFRNFPGDSTTLVNNVINALYTEDDNLWVGTGSGLSRININTGVLKNFT